MIIGAGLCGAAQPGTVEDGGAPIASSVIPDDSWTVIDHETITGERRVTGEKVHVVGECVIKEDGRLVVDGVPEIVCDGAFKVEKGGKILAPGLQAVVDPETGLVTLEPKVLPTVTDLRFSQRYPWNGLVDVFFTTTYAADPSAKVWVKLAAKLDGADKPVNALCLASDPSVVSTQFKVGQGETHLVWDTMKDVGPDGFGALAITAQAALVSMAEEPGEVRKLRFKALSASSLVVRMNGIFTAVPSLEYSYDGAKWTEVKFGSLLGIAKDGEIYLRGLNPNGLSKSDSAYVTVMITGGVEVSGSVMALIDYRNAVAEIPCDYCFYRLFAGALVTSAPELPATVLKPHCYEEMFAGSNYLVNGPDLVAEFVPSCAYCGMFADCSSLASVGCGANTVSSDDAFDLWLDNVMPKGMIYIIGNGEATMLEHHNALPFGWGFGKPLVSGSSEGEDAK